MEMNRYLAHISPVGREQLVEDHLRTVATFTSNTLSFIGLTSLGYLSGLVHDMGKYTDRFNDYIHRAAAGENVTRGSVNHTFAGVIFIWERFHNSSDKHQVLLCELICCAVGSHHGLFDCIDPEGKSGFLHRLRNDRNDLLYDEAKEGFLRYCAGYEEIDELFEKAKKELDTIIPMLQKPFYRAALERLITSALIDADRKDTANFMLNKAETELKLGDIAASAFANLENRLSGFPSESPVQRSRRAFSEKCILFAEKTCGVYRLALPTGSGKTLLSLRFALKKSVCDPDRVKRIFYVAPLLTVLEQNAKEIRESVGEADWVLEHHSNVVFDANKADELARYELLSENWSAPIIVTTLVQLLNTLFSSNTTCVRRMQALCGSVLIIDEVQSLPLKTLSIFNGMINFITKVCGATVVLCSATQPELIDANIKLKLDMGKDADMVQYDETLWAPFERADIVDGRNAYGFDSAGLADLAIKQLLAFDNVLLICNTRKNAADIYTAVKQLAPQGTEVMHLSAAMCQKHRCDCLERLKKAIDPASGKKTICISTQLIEAGVDISFGCVIRTLAGLDSIAQAAGRCNRHGELTIDGAPAHGKVIIVRCKDENTAFLKEIQLAQHACEALLNEYKKDPQTFGGSLLSAKAVSVYYSELYLESNSKTAGNTEYPVALGADSTTIYTLLSNNKSSKQYSSTEVINLNTVMNQAFKTAGDCFEVFDEGSCSLIVPYDDTAKAIINELCTLGNHYNLSRVKQLINMAKPYLVSVYDSVKSCLDEAGAVISLSCCEGSVLAVNQYMPGIYDKETGLTVPQRSGEAYYI